VGTIDRRELTLRDQQNRDSPPTLAIQE